MHCFRVLTYSTEHLHCADLYSTAAGGSHIRQNILIVLTCSALLPGTHIFDRTSSLCWHVLHCCRRLTCSKLSGFFLCLRMLHNRVYLPNVVVKATVSVVFSTFVCKLLFLDVFNTSPLCDSARQSRTGGLPPTFVILQEASETANDFKNRDTPIPAAHVRRSENRRRRLNTGLLLGQRLLFFGVSLNPIPSLHASFAMPDQII